MDDAELIERFIALERDVAAFDRLVAALRSEDRRAMSLATEAIDDRLNLLNELRGNVITKDEFEGRHAAIIAKLESHVQRSDERLASIEREQGATRSLRLAVYALMPLMAGILIAIVAHTLAGG